MRSGDDLSAQTALALRLLREASSRAEGLALLKDAADKGDGEALAVMAVFVAGGVLEGGDWGVALGYLADAADAGWADARDELRFLADDGAGVDWRALAARVAIEHWLTPPRPRIVCEAPRIGVIEGLLWPGACTWFMSLGAGWLKPAAVYDAAEAIPRRAHERTNSDFPFDLFRARVSTCLLQARIEAALGAPVETFEALTLMHYARGEEFTPHHDFLDPAIPGHAADLRHRGQRVMTALVWLNDDFEGGETAFPLIDFSFRGRPGDALVFANVGPDGAPDSRTLHAGGPPTQGEKWILSQWIRDRPQQW